MSLCGCPDCVALPLLMCCAASSDVFLVPFIIASLARALPSDLYDGTGSYISWGSLIEGGIGPA